MLLQQINIKALLNILERASNPNNVFFDSRLALFISIGCFFVPIALLSIYIVVKRVIKWIKFNRKVIPEEVEDVKEKYMKLFGNNNIESISKKMTRVSVVVKDLEQVDFDGLRNLNVGVMITGNTIKCSSQEFADQIEE